MALALQNRDGSFESGGTTLQLFVSSSGFRDGLGERDLAFDRQTGHVWERLLLRAELSAFEAALRRRVTRLSLIENPRLVPLRGVDRDPLTSKLVVVSRHVSGTRLSSLLRAAREREIVPDFTVAILLTAEVLGALHTLHDAANYAHGAVSADRVILSPSGEVVLADYAYAEVLEAVRFSAQRLWEQFGIAHWLDESFSVGADVRQAVLIAIALTLGRPIDHEDFPRALAPLREEVQEAAMIRGGRLFAEPVGAWITRALETGRPGGFDSAAEAADACAELLTERERDMARRGLLQFLEDVTAPFEDEPAAAVEPPRAPKAAPVAAPAARRAPTEHRPPAPAPVPAPSPVIEMAPARAAAKPVPEPVPVVDEPASTVEPAAPPEPVRPVTPPVREAQEEPAVASERVAPAVPPEPVSEPVPAATPIPPVAPAPLPEPLAAPVPAAAMPEPPSAAVAPPPAPEPVVATPPAPAPKPAKKRKRDGRHEREEKPAAAAAQVVTAWPPPPVSVFDSRPEQPPHVVSPSPFAALDGAPISAAPFVPTPEPPPPAPPPSAAPVPFPPTPAFTPPAPAVPPAAPQVAFSPATTSVVPSPPVAAPPPPPATTPIRLAAASPVAASARTTPSDGAQAPGIRLKNPAPPRRSQRAETGLSLSDCPAPFDQQEDQTAQFRKFWKFVAAGIAVLVAGLAAVNVEWSGADAVAAPGVLVVETVPSGSDLFIDGKPHGKTPTQVEVEPGTHEVKLTRDGASHSWSVEVVSGARRVEKLNWSALQQTGGIEVVTNAPGAKVLVDGQPRGETPLTLTDLAPGRHTVVVQGPSGSVRRSVTVAAGKTLKLDFEIYSGWVVVSAPIELQVAQKGAVIGTAGEGPLVLPAGRQTIELVNEALGYRASYTLDIEPGEEERLTVTPMGSANVNAIPWAEVFVDGTRLGETPLANAQVPLGTREIVFRHPQYGERRVTTTVTAASPAQVTVDFTKP